LSRSHFTDFGYLYEVLHVLKWERISVAHLNCGITLSVIRPAGDFGL